MRKLHFLFTCFGSFLLKEASSLLAAGYSTRPQLPGDDPFYAPPPGFADKRPGTILRHRQVPFPLTTVNVSAAYQILYRTTNTFGEAIATVTTIYVPHNATKTKLLSYQVAEDAANINCSPSYVFREDSQTGGPYGTLSMQMEMYLIKDALKNGWYVTIPDFLGPNSAFLANTLAGHAVLDGVRATLASSEFTHLATDPTIAMWGYSGGSLASGFAAELQPIYAPELKISGVALGGTVPDILSALHTNKLFGGTVYGINCDVHHGAWQRISRNFFPDRDGGCTKQSWTYETTKELVFRGSTCWFCVPRRPLLLQGS